MSCSEIQKTLPLLLTGDLNPEEANQVNQHLAGCASCRKEKAALQELRKVLDRVPESSDPLDIGGLYRELALRDRRRARNWRRFGLIASVAAAALLVMLIGRRCELRWEAHQIALSWGSPGGGESGAETRPARSSPDSRKPAPAVLESSEEVLDQLQVMSELVRGLADENEARERRSETAFASLQVRIEALQRQVAERYASLERDVAALCGTELTQARKGTVP